MKRWLAVAFSIFLVFNMTSSLAVVQEFECGDFTYTLENNEATVVRYNGTETNVEFPSTVNGYPVTALGDNVYGFYDNKFVSITIPEGVKYINKVTFSSSKDLISVSLPNSLQTIGAAAFNSCDQLTSIVIPAGITNISSGALNSCKKLKSIQVADGNEAYLSIDGVLFDKSGKMLHTYPAGKTEKSYNVPSGTTSIGDSAFSSVQTLNSINLPDSLEQIGKNAFVSCNKLKSITIPMGVTIIPSYCFFQCAALTKIELHDNITSIGDYAFDGCKATSFHIPKATISIGDGALANLPIKKFDVDKDNTMFKEVDGVLFDTTGSTLVCYPIKKSGKSYTVPEGTLSIGNYAFTYCKALTAVKLPTSILYIGDGAFSYCSALTAIELPKGLVEIGAKAFSGCKKLQMIVIPDGISNLGENAFASCTNLKNVIIGEGPDTINDFVFCFCENLTVTLPDSVNSIKEYAFLNSKNITIIAKKGSIGQTFAISNGFTFVAK
jgi:hypothetical protein